MNKDSFIRWIIIGAIFASGLGATYLNHKYQLKKHPTPPMQIVRE